MYVEISIPYIAARFIMNAFLLRIVEDRHVSYTPIAGISLIARYVAKTMDNI
jgi:hypothetical protein